MCCREVQLSSMSGKLTSHLNMDIHKLCHSVFHRERERERMGWGWGWGWRLCGVCVHESGLGWEEAEDSCVVERYSYHVCQES